MRHQPAHCHPTWNANERVHLSAFPLPSLPWGFSSPSADLASAEQRTTPRAAAAAGWLILWVSPKPAGFSCFKARIYPADIRREAYDQDVETQQRATTNDDAGREQGQWARVGRPFGQRARGVNASTLAHRANPVRRPQPSRLSSAGLFSTAHHLSLSCKDPANGRGVFFFLGSVLMVEGGKKLVLVVLKTVLPYSATVERRPVVQHVRFALADVDSCQKN